MIYFYLLFLTRFFTVLPLTILLGKQLINFSKYKEDRLNTTRTALLICTFAIWFDTSLYIIGDFHQLFFIGNKQIWLSNIKPILVISRIFVLYGVWKFYKLLYEK